MKKKISICLLTSSFFPKIGGMEIVVHNLAKALCRFGHRVVVVAPVDKFEKNDKTQPYFVKKFGFRGSSKLHMTSFLAAATLVWTVKKFSIDIIHVHDVFNPGIWIKKFKNVVKDIPVIGTPHGDDIQMTPEILDGVRLNPKFDKIVKGNLQYFDRITAISSSIRNDINLMGYDLNRVIDIPNGVWIDDFKNNNNRDEIRNKFGIPISSIAIISVGRNHPRKGFDYGLEAFAKLKKEGVNVVYIIVGRNTDSINSQSKYLSLRKDLILPGQVDNATVIELLHASDIFLSTSIVESFGINTLEAMSAGLPCVVTNVPGSIDLISNECGILVKPKDSTAIANGLIKLIDDPILAQKMGENARVKSFKYDWSNIATKYLKVYDNIIRP